MFMYFLCQYLLLFRSGLQFDELMDLIEKNTQQKGSGEQAATDWLAEFIVTDSHYQDIVGWFVQVAITHNKQVELARIFNGRIAFPVIAQQWTKDQLLTNPLVSAMAFEFPEKLKSQYQPQQPPQQPSQQPPPPPPSSQLQITPQTEFESTFDEEQVTPQIAQIAQAAQIA